SWRYLDLRDLHSFPTRRSSDLDALHAGLPSAPTTLQCSMAGFAVVSWACACAPHATPADVYKSVCTGNLGLTPDPVPTWCICLRSEEHTSELQSRFDLVCRLLL